MGKPYTDVLYCGCSHYVHFTCSHHRLYQIIRARKPRLDFISRVFYIKSTTSLFKTKTNQTIAYSLWNDAMIPSTRVSYWQWRNSSYSFICFENMLNYLSVSWWHMCIKASKVDSCAALHPDIDFLFKLTLLNSKIRTCPST